MWWRSHREVSWSALGPTPPPHQFHTSEWCGEEVKVEKLVKSNKFHVTHSSDSLTVGYYTSDEGQLTSARSRCLTPWSNAMMSDWTSSGLAGSPGGLPLDAHKANEQGSQHTSYQHAQLRTQHVWYVAFGSAIHLPLDIVHYYTDTITPKISNNHACLNQRVPAPYASGGMLWPSLSVNSSILWALLDIMMSDLNELENIHVHHPTLSNFEVTQWNNLWFVYRGEVCVCVSWVLSLFRQGHTCV